MIAPLLTLALALLPGPAAWAQSSLGQTGTLPPPRAAAPTPPAAPAEAPRPAPPTPPRPAAPSAARPPQAATPAPARPAPVVEPRASSAPRRAGTPPTGPAQRQALPPPAAPGAAAPGATPPRRRPPAAAAGAAAGAAGAVAVVRPPEPARPAEPPPPPVQRVGTATGLPLPRFAALGSNQVNLRVGPDLRYPIEWTYQRKDLPVQIVDEHQHWRRIRDSEGTEGWVQRPLLTSRRSFLVQGQERIMRRSPEDSAAEVARLRPGVVGRLRRCEEGSAWCETQVGDYRGWLKRSEIFGVTAHEEVK